MILPTATRPKVIRSLVSRNCRKQAHAVDELSLAPSVSVRYRTDHHFRVQRTPTYADEIAIARISVSVQNRHGQREHAR